MILLDFVPSMECNKNLVVLFYHMILVLTKSTLSSASQWKDLRNNKIVNSATNFGLKSSLKTVNAKHVSVTAYHDLSIKCCKDDYSLNDAHTVARE
jgi:hypothetical protein